MLAAELESPVFFFFSNFYCVKSNLCIHAVSLCRVTYDMSHVFEPKQTKKKKKLPASFNHKTDKPKKGTSVLTYLAQQVEFLSHLHFCHFSFDVFD